MEAVVLAGGLGTRLRAVVADRPKPMAPVAGRPFLEILLDALADRGIRGFTLCTGHLGEQIESHFGDRHRGLPVRYSREARPLGTGGAIRRALAALPDRESPVFVVNGDTYVEVDYAAVWRLHRNARPEPRITVVLRRVGSTERFGRVEVEGGRIVAFAERGDAGPGLINAGVYLVSPRLFEAWPDPLPEAFSFERDVLAPGASRVAPLAWVAEGRFVDIGVPESYAAAAQEIGLARPADPDASGTR